MVKNNYFDNTKNIKSLKQKFDYIKEHFTYYTMNSWNRLEGIANKVKIYSLGLTGEQENKAFNIIYANDGYNEFWDDVNMILRDAKIDKGLKIGFNGRNDGYIVLYNNENNGSAINDIYYEFDDLKEYINYLKDGGYTHKEAYQDASYTIENDFEMVKEFDRVCDNIRATLIYYIDNAKIIQEEVQQVKTIQVTRLYFA